MTDQRPILERNRREVRAHTGRRTRPPSTARSSSPRRACGPSTTLLEIGCGTGSLALRLAPSAAHIHGLDISQRDGAHRAREGGERRRTDNVTFHVGPFDDSFTAFAPESFDGICAYSILHLMEDRPAALARMFSLLKPGGFFASSTAVLGESLVPYRPILAVARALGRRPRW
jgi:arsenite methyltransferase